MTTPQLTVLDSSRFPLVKLDPDKAATGGIEMMIADFEVLLGAGQGFVLCRSGEHRGPEQSHDDQKRWVLWLKANRDRLASCCRGVVSVTDATSDHALQQRQADGMQAMLGIPVRLADNAEEADQIAVALLN